MKIEYSIVLFFSFFIIMFGLFLLWKLGRLKLAKNLSHQVSSFIIDAVKIYGLRSFSAIFQSLLYTSLIFLIFSNLISTYFLWDQVLAFFLGGISMSLGLFLLSVIIPKLIPKILDKARGYLTDVMLIQFKSVSLIGFLCVGICIFNGFILMCFTSFHLLIGYTLGIIFSSFFTRLSGGLYMASSVLGEHISQLRFPELPFEDRRNPGYIITISARYIHKICGFCSDIMGSYMLSILSIIILIYTFHIQQLISDQTFHYFVILFISIIILGFIGSFFGYLVAIFRIKRRFLQNPLLESLYVALFISVIGVGYIISLLDFDVSQSIWFGFNVFRPFYAYFIGLVGGFVICYMSERFTTVTYGNVKKCAKEAEFGPSMIQLFSMGMGLKSNFAYIVVILFIAIIAYLSAGLFGIAIATLSMLSLTITIISINSFFPFAQSLYQIGFISTDSVTILNQISKMKVLGQSTVAIGNVFSSVSALFSCFSVLIASILFKNYLFLDLFSLDLFWLVGLILGVIIPMVTGGYLLESCRNISKFFSNEISRQFEQIPYLTEGKAHPDIILCSDKIARMSMDGLIIPGVLTMLIPMILGFFINVPTLVAFSIGALMSTISTVVYWTLTGDLLHNSKEYIDSGKYGGKTSPFYNYSNNLGVFSVVYKDVLNPGLSTIIKSIVIITSVMMIFLT